MSTVAVIGAGIAGLSAACHLVGRGHEVVLLERHDAPGGGDCGSGRMGSPSTPAPR